MSDATKRDSTTQEIWFLTGSQHLYGEETLRQVTAHSKEMAGFLEESGRLPVRVVWKPILTRPDEITDACLQANAAPACAGVVTWMHTFSPAKMWIGGLTRLDKPLAAPAHPVQPGAALGRHRHGLHEPQPVRPRRPGVRVHRGPPAHAAQDRGGLLEGRRGAGRAGGLVPHRPRLLRVAPAQDRPLRRRQHARGGGDRRRPGGGADQARLGHQRPRRGRPGAPRPGGERRAGEGARRRVRVELRRRAGAAQGRRAARGAAPRGPPGGRHEGLPGGGRLRRLHHHLRGPARPARAARLRLPAAHGPGLRLRRRGRLEDGRPGAPHEDHDRRASPAACPSWKTTPTTW